MGSCGQFFQSACLDSLEEILKTLMHSLGACLDSLEEIHKTLVHSLGVHIWTAEVSELHILYLKGIALGVFNFGGLKQVPRVRAA